MLGNVVSDIDTHRNEQRCAYCHWWFLAISIAGGLLHTALLWHWPGSDSDFAGLCCFAESISRGLNPANPYFPPGYPLLLWLGVQLGFTCLQAAALLNGGGLALATYHTAALWRRFGTGPWAAGFGAVLLLMLPDVIWTYQSPHVDGLMLGLSALWVHSVIAIWRGSCSRTLGIGGALAGALLLLSRWHMLLVVVPGLIVLALVQRRELRRWLPLMGIPALLAAVVAFGALYASTGSLNTSARLQIFTGLCYTAPNASEATIAMSGDYAAFAVQRRDESVLATVGWRRLIEHTLRNFHLYLTRKATLAGLALFMVVGLAFRAWPRGAGWIALFAVCYSLAVSVSYFVHRASCLPEWCGVVLIGASLGGLAPRWRSPAWTWLGIACALGLSAYGATMVSRSYVPAVSRRITSVLNSVRPYVNNGAELVGWNEYSWCTETPPWNLPAASLNRLWMDDPVLDRLTASYPRYTTEQLMSGDAAANCILVNLRERWPEIELVRQWAESEGWHKQPAPPGYEVWVRPE